MHWRWLTPCCLLGVLTVSALFSAETAGFSIISVTDPVRSGELIRVELQNNTALTGAGRIQIAVLQQSQVIAAADFIVNDLSSFQQPANIVLQPVTTIQGTGPALRAVATVTPTKSAPLSSDRAVTSVEHIYARFAAYDQQFATSTDPLLNVFLEMAAEIIIQPPTPHGCHELKRIYAKIDAWSRNRNPTLQAGENIRAIRDSVDGGMLPIRIYGAPQPQAQRWALLLCDTVSPSKHAWPDPPTAVLAPLLTQGYTVIMAYPAADATWTGCAPHRAVQAWKTHAPSDATCLIVATGRAAGAAVALAAQGNLPTVGVLLWHPLAPVADPVLAAASPPSQPISWLAATKTEPTLLNWLQTLRDRGVAITDCGTAWPEHITTLAKAQAIGSISAKAPLLALNQRIPGRSPMPAAIIVGTQEHQAAQLDNRALATAFAQAWIAHGQTALPIFADTVDLSTLPAGHLICVGNPRSNKILANLIANGLDPLLNWDARSIRGEGRQWLRADRLPILIRRPLPSDPSRWVIILDGTWSWSNQQLPTGSLPDLWVGPPALLPDGEPALSRWLDSNWR